MPHYDIITFGDTAIDLLITGRDVTPQFGQAEKWVEGYSLELGGSCCLFAAQAAKLGLRVAVLGRVGDDHFGRLLLQKLNEAGVDTRYITVDPTLKTGLTLALSHTRSNDRAMLTYGGSLQALTPDDVTDEFLQSARHLHYGSLFLHTGLLPNWVTILRRAKGFGATISLDTNWDPSERWESGLGEALPLVDVLMPNEREARFITRQPSVEKAVNALRQQVKLLTLKLGEEGARLYTGAEKYACTPPPAERGGDSTGAGDSFDAGFLAGWLNNLPLQTCLDIACQCGRSVAGYVGGYEGQLWRKDVAALR